MILIWLYLILIDFIWFNWFYLNLIDFIWFWLFYFVLILFYFNLSDLIWSWFYLGQQVFQKEFSGLSWFTISVASNPSSIWPTPAIVLESCSYRASEMFSESSYEYQLVLMIFHTFEGIFDHKSILMIKSSYDKRKKEQLPKFWLVWTIMKTHQLCLCVRIENNSSHTPLIH